jgi:copper resistance protein C
MMMFRSLLAGAALAVTTISVPPIANAHSRVTASMPAQGVTVRAPRIVTLTFSDAMLPPTTAASIVMTAMPGVPNHGEMIIRNFTPAWSNGNRTLTLTLRQPLRAGTYEVRWQATGADNHRMTGIVNFIVS